MDEQLPSVSEFDVLWSDEEVYGRPLRRNPPRSLNRDRNAMNIEEVFHMVGGVPRLANWADEHYGYFMTKLYPKILPQGASISLNAGSINFTYNASIPPSPLDRATENSEPTDVEFQEISE